MGYWNSDHNPDGTLKPGFKSFDTEDESCNESNRKPCNSGQSLKSKKSVIFHIARSYMPLEISHLRLSGPLLNDGAPYSGIGFHELKILIPYLRTNWNGK